MKWLPQLFFLYFFALPKIYAAQPATNLWELRISNYVCDSSPALAPDGMIYQATFDGKLLAVTPDGKIKWTFKAGREIKSSPAIGNDGTIYFGSRDWKFYAVTPKGKLKWTFQTGAWVDSSPAIALDGTIYFGSWDTNFYALNPDGSLKWKFPTGGIIDSSPAIAADGTIYFGSHDGNFYALSPEGKLRWKFSTQGEITSSPAIGNNGTIYFTSTDGNLYALNSDGTKKWSFKTDGANESSPVLDKKRNVYVTAGYHFLSFGDDGKKIWQWPAAGVWVDSSAMVLANDTVYFPQPWRRLTRAQTDHPYKIIDHIETPSNVSSSPVVGANGMIYVTGGRFLIAATTTNSAPLAKSSWPMFRANPQHTGRVQPF